MTTIPKVTGFVPAPGKYNITYDWGKKKPDVG